MTLFNSLIVVLLALVFPVERRPSLRYERA
jgi:hypothetical protein